MYCIVDAELTGMPLGDSRISCFCPVTQCHFFLSKFVDFLSEWKGDVNLCIWLWICVDLNREQTKDSIIKILSYGGNFVLVWETLNREPWQYWNRSTVFPQKDFAWCRCTLLAIYRFCNHLFAKRNKKRIENETGIQRRSFDEIHILQKNLAWTKSSEVSRSNEVASKSNFKLLDY